MLIAVVLLGTSHILDVLRQHNFIEIRRYEVTK